MSLEPEMSFDAVIPSAILLNENVELTAVKLYAFIRSLTRVHGYCYASNKYLSSLMKSTERSITNWLSRLSAEGYVKVETQKNGISWQRRIYISDDFKKKLRKELQFYPPRNTVLPPPNQNSTILREEYKEEENNKRESVRGRAQSPISKIDENKSLETKKPLHHRENPDSDSIKKKKYGSHVMVNEKEYLDLSVLAEGDENLNRIIESMNDYLKAHGKRPYKDFAAALRNWIRKDIKSNPEIKRTEGPKRLLSRLKEYVESNKIKDIVLGPSYVDFVGSYDACYKTTDLLFEEKVLHQLRKRGIPIKN